MGYYGGLERDDGTAVGEGAGDLPGQLDVRGRGGWGGGWGEGGGDHGVEMRLEMKVDRVGRE